MRLATSLALAVLLLLAGCQDTPPRDKLLSPGETVAYVTEDGRIYLDGLLVAEPGDRALRAFATEVTRLHRDSLRKGRKSEILLRAEKAAGVARVNEALDAIVASGGPGKIPVCLEVLDP
jgi:biopolymer transport protein ExbD